METAPGSFLVRKEPAPLLATLRRRSGSIVPSATGGTRHRCFLARNAIYHGIGALGLRSGDRVLAPAYVCRAAVVPIVARGIDVDFYRVGRRCEADLADIESRIGGKTRALMVVHYFGFAQEMAAITALCHRRGLYLIEDCAHVFGGIEELDLGTHGDISVFSWRKFLPLFDGGDLVFNREVEFSPQWDRESLLFTFKVAKRLFDQWAANKPWSNRVDQLLGVVKNSLLAISSESSVPNAELQADTASLDFDLRFAKLPMSRLSRWLLAHSHTERIVARRRENYRHLRGLLDPLATQSLHPDLPARTCPWIYPVFVGELANAHLQLRGLGIPAVTWGGVRPDGLRRNDYPDADHLYDNLVFLPIHQDLGPDAMERIAQAVRAVTRSR